MVSTLSPSPLRYHRPSWQAFKGPLLLLVWGMAVATLLWGSGIDVAIQRWLFANYEQGFNTAMRVLGEIGKGTAQIVFCVVIGAAWALNGWLRGGINRRGISHLLAAVPVFLIAGILNWLMKWSIGRGRPKDFLLNGTNPYEMHPFAGHALWWSFPSGHSCSTFAIAVWLGLAFPRWRYVCWIVATVLSFSRFLAVTPHFFGDVVAGAAVGAAVAWALWRMTHQQEVKAHD